MFTPSLADEMHHQDEAHHAEHDDGDQEQKEQVDDHVVLVDQGGGLGNTVECGFGEQREHGGTEV